jgi:hypothetical protein
LKEKVTEFSLNYKNSILLRLWFRVLRIFTLF